MGIIAPYGPDNTRATKLVASVYKRPRRGDPDALYRWEVLDGDIRENDAIAGEIAATLRRHRVKDTVTMPRIIGCPHEEGIDYPMGRTCPQCPFWAGIDRFTHEPLPVPVATMTPDEVIADLSVPDRVDHPYEALESADAHREALVPRLLEAVEQCLDDPKGASASEAMLFSYALYLLAKWRETRAYPIVIRWLSLPGEGAFDIGGDIVTQDGGRILAAVCDGNLEPIQSLVLNRHANEFGRSMGIEAFALLGAWAEVPFETIVEYFAWLAREGLEREPTNVWSALADQSACIEAVPVFADLYRAYDEGLIDPLGVAREDLEEVEATEPGEILARTLENRTPIDDVAEATSWWSCFERDEDKDDREYENHPDDDGGEPIETYRAGPKVGRNEPCPCGSGKKYKKCCG